MVDPSYCAMAFEREPGDWEWLEVLGRGTGGTCRKIRDRTCGEIRVVKQIDVSFVTKDEYDSAMLEAELLSSVKHPNVVRFYDSFIHDEMLHILMEYCPNGTLKEMLSALGAPLPETKSIRLMRQVLSGLAYLHGRKIVHRDLKSQNIFMSDGDVPKLGDFGVAKRLNSAQPMAVSVVGTPLYLSPELCNGLPYDTKSDVWAIGCLLYEVCSQGRLPFQASNHGAVIKKIIMGEYAPLSSSYSKDLHKLVEWCLQQAPASRPNAEELMGRLDHLLISREAGEMSMSGAETVVMAGDISVQGSDDVAADFSSPKKGPQGSSPNFTTQAPRPLWWDGWGDAKDEFISGTFRTLYGGTPQKSPERDGVGGNAYFGLKPIKGKSLSFDFDELEKRSESSAIHSDFHHDQQQQQQQEEEQQQGQKKQQIGVFARHSIFRPASAPQTPSESESIGMGRPRPLYSRDGAQRSSAHHKHLLDFLKSTPAITEGPLQGPFWSASAGIDDLEDEDSPSTTWDGVRGPDSGGGPAAFTQVTDLSRWLQEYKKRNGGDDQGFGKRPTSSPDCSNQRLAGMMGDRKADRRSMQSLIAIKAYRSDNKAKSKVDASPSLGRDGADRLSHAQQQPNAHAGPVQRSQCDDIHSSSTGPLVRGKRLFLNEPVGGAGSTLSRTGAKILEFFPCEDKDKSMTSPIARYAERDLAMGHTVKDTSPLRKIDPSGSSEARAGDVTVRGEGRAEIFGVSGLQLQGRSINAHRGAAAAANANNAHTNPHARPRHQQGGGGATLLRRPAPVVHSQVLRTLSVPDS